jgi:putative AlgH/UPF0301 family transcriptional regulator
VSTAIQFRVGELLVAEKVITQAQLQEALTYQEIHGGRIGACLVTLGYAGWGAGQLESEIAQNAWLTVNAAPQIIFDVPAVDKYDAALRLLGVNSSQLTGHAGHA